VGSCHVDVAVVNSGDPAPERPVGDQGAGAFSLGELGHLEIGIAEFDCGIWQSQIPRDWEWRLGIGSADSIEAGCLGGRFSLTLDIWG
jgi:hypothetical protein